MRPSDITELFDHLYWIRDRILAAADHEGVPLTSEARVTGRDLRALLVHELDIEWSWRERLRAPDPTHFSASAEDMDPTDFRSIAVIRTRWLQDEREMRAWIRTLDQEALDARCRAEPDAAHPFWIHLQHLYTHAMQQFSDCAVTLTLAGRSPGELDFLDFVLERERAPRA
jgi:hypothetical protein